MVKRIKLPKRRSFEAFSLRIHVPKILPDRRKPKEKKITVKNFDIEL
jgi:hypothetical protein